MESGVSDVVATVLIIIMVVAILVSAIFVIDVNLPGRTSPAANVVDTNVTFHFSSGNLGYIAGSFLYQSGPTLSNGSALFQVIVGGKVYSYSLSSFASAGDNWSKIMSGTVVIFNSSRMLDQDGQTMPLLSSGENYTMNFLLQGSSVWRYAASALPSSSRPIIAYSWYQVSSSQTIDVITAVYGNGSVKVHGNFSKLYGYPYGYVSFSPTSSPGIYNATLPTPPYSGYYQIIISSDGYHADEWFYLNWTTLTTSNYISKNDTLNIFFNGEPGTYLTSNGVAVQVTNPATVSTFIPAMVSSNQFSWYGKWLTLTTNESFNDSALQGTTQSIAVEINFPQWLRLFSVEGPSSSNLQTEKGNALTYNYSVGYVTFIVKKDAPTNIYVNFSVKRYVTVDFSGFPTWGRWSGSLYFNGTVSLAPESFTNVSFSDFVNTTWISFQYHVGFSVVDLNSHQKFTVTYSNEGVLNENNNVTVFVNATTPPVRYYHVWFNEQGLPSGTVWQVSMNNTHISSTTAQISYLLPNGSYPWSVSIVPGWHSSSYGGTLTISGSNVTVNLTWTQVKYNETFTESGLPSGTMWSVTVGGISYSSDTNTITLSIPNATYSWKLGIVAGWTGNPYSGSITVDGMGGNVAITFTRTLYQVTFVENGLNTNALWNVTFNATMQYTRSGTITFSVPNGTYTFTVGKRWGWAISPVSGTITVNGVAVTEDIQFVPIPTYTVTFEESGIAPGARWTVNVTNMSNNGVNSSSAVVTSSNPWSSSISFEEFNGQYAYVTYSPGFMAYWWSVGSPITVNGNDVIIRIQFKAVYYNLYAVPVGLPDYTSWTFDLKVNGNWENYSGYYAPWNNGSISYSLPNGTYEYSVPRLNGYGASPSSGVVTVNGREVTLDVNFVRIGYVIWFNETGLEPGAIWYVNLSTGSFRGTGSSIAITEYDGNYQYSISASGYTVSPSSGWVYVNGANQSVYVTFYASVVFVPHGLGQNVYWWVQIYEQQWPYSSYSQGGYGNLTFQGLSGGYTYSVISNINAGGGYQYAVESETPSSPINVAGPMVVNVYYSEQVYVQAYSTYSTYLWGYYNGQVEGPYYDAGWFYVGSAVYASSQEAFYGDQYMSSGVVSSIKLVNQSLDYGGQTYGGYPNWWFNNPQGNFVMMFYGWVYAPQYGLYNIGTTSDDGSAVWVSSSPQIYDWSNLVVNNWYQQGANFRYGSTYLQKGFNYVVVAYEQGNGGYMLNLQWQPPGQSWQEMPVSGTTYIYDAPFPSSSTGTMYSPSADGGNPTAETFYDPVFWSVQSISSPTTVSATWSYDYYYLSTFASPSSGGSVSPGSGWYQYGQYVQISAAPSSGYTFQSWESLGSWGGSLTQNGYVYVYGALSLTAIFDAALIFVPENLPQGTYWEVYTDQWGWQGGVGNIVFTGQSGNVFYQVQSPLWAYDSNLGEWTYLYARPASGTVTVNGPTTVYIDWVIPLWTAWFNETGLAAGTQWSVTINGVTHYSSSSTVSFSEPYGSYYYTINTPVGYSSQYGTNGWVYLQGNNQTVNVVFTAVIWFIPQGLPYYTWWSVQVINWGSYSGYYAPGNNGSIQVQVPLGYSFDAYSTGYYDPNPSSGVINQPGIINIYYTAPQHPIFFNETGLAGGSVWSVDMNGVVQTSSSSSIVFWENPGQYYSYTITANGYQVSPSSGSVYVSNYGQTVNVNLQAAIVFVPTGLSSGDSLNWQVYVSGYGWGYGYYNGPGTGSITIIPWGGYGWYSYQVPSPTYGYYDNNWVPFYPNPSSNSFYFGGPETIYINWYVPLYSVTFTETGLPSGTSWSVTLGGNTQTTTASSVTFEVPDGGYYYTAQATGYTMNPSSGWVSVSGQNQVVNLGVELGTVWFTPVGLYGGYRGSSQGTGWYITVNGGDTYYGFYGWREHVFYYRGWHVYWYYSNGSIPVTGLAVGSPYSVQTSYNSYTGEYYYPNPSSGSVDYGGTFDIYFNAAPAPPSFKPIESAPPFAGLPHGQIPGLSLSSILQEADMNIDRLTEENGNVLISFYQYRYGNI